MNTQPSIFFPATPSRSAERLHVAWFWLSCVLLGVLLVSPLATTLYPGMPDYPNHLARAQLIVDEHLHRLAHPYYALRHVLIPNLALDVLVPLFVQTGLDTNGALKLFAGLSLVLPVAGVIALGRVLQRGTPWLALLAFPLAFSRYYAWGFLNYFFALGLALLAFAAWLALRPARPGVAGLVLALAGATTMVSHLVGFGVLVLLVATREAWWAWRARRIDWRATLPAMLALAACAAFYLLAFERGLSLSVEWLDNPWRKLRNTISPFMAYGMAPAVGVAVLVIGTLALLRARRQLVMQPGWLPATLVFALAFALLPSVIMNSYFASARLFVVAALVFLAFATLRGNAHAQAGIALAALAATALKTADVHEHWSATSARTVQLREAMTALPEGSKLFTAITVDYHRGSDIYPLRHVGAFAVTDRQAFIANFFGFPTNGEAVAFRPEVQELARLQANARIAFQSFEPIPWDLVCARYDALLVIEQSHRPDLPACTRPLRRGDGWGLYRVVR